MHLIFLHGAPATGKYTVGRELAVLTGFELFHNHIVVDDVLRRHAFGTPEFVAERDAAWRAKLTAATCKLTQGLIFTFNPEDTVPQEFINWLFYRLPADTGALLCSVELTASEPEIEARLSTAQRGAFRKLTDLALYRKLRDEGRFRAPVIPHSDLSLSTTQITPDTTAQTIAEYFKLV